MLKYTNFVAVGALLAAAVACSSGGPEGLPTLPSALPTAGLFITGTAAAKGLVVVLSADASTCEDLGQNVKRKGETLVTLSLASADPNGSPRGELSPGLYTLVPEADFEVLQPGSSALVFGLSQYDSSCSAATRFADSGSVALTQVDGGTVVGSYDVMLGGLHYTGSFDTAFCDPTASLSTGTATPQCE